MLRPLVLPQRRNHTVKHLTKTFFPHLDALRFFAFLAVFVNHTFNSLGYYNSDQTYQFIVKNFFSNGDLGVSFFFVLSGFLITYLLLEEKTNTGRIDIKKFYVRRVLRIWPVYFLVVGTGLLLLPLLSPFIPPGFPLRHATDKLNPWLYIGFAGNFDYLYNGISNVVIGILWSVSIEEQFYLFWPLVMAFVPSKRLLPVLVSLIAASVLFRFYFSRGGNINIINHHSFSCASDLITGAALAYLAMQPAFVESIRRMPAFVIRIIYFIGFALLPFRNYIWKFGVHYVHVASILPVLVAVFFAFILAEQCYADHSFFKGGNWKRISKLGTRTYGMYCYHMTVFFIVLFLYGQLGIPVSKTGILQHVFTSLLCLLLTVGISQLSYRYVEAKFLELKKKFVSA